MVYLFCREKSLYIGLGSFNNKIVFNLFQKLNNRILFSFLEVWHEIFLFFFSFMKSWQIGKKTNPQICMYKKGDEMDALKHPRHRFQIEDKIVFLLF